MTVEAMRAATRLMSALPFPRISPHFRGFSRARRAMAAFALCVLFGLGTAAAAEPIRVGSKIDTEGALLGHMIVLLLQNAGYPVESRVQLGPTKIVREALLSGEIDVYPEYTGNVAFFFHREHDDAFRQADTAYQQARLLDWQRNRLVWLQPAPADNSWGIALRKDVAARNGLRTLEDFGRWISAGGKVKLACSAEFVESDGALPALQRAYGFKLSAWQLLVLAGGDTTATIKAAMEGNSGVNAAMVYQTDGAVAVAGLTVLENPKRVQMVYQPAPVVRAVVLQRNPGMRQALEPAFRTLNADTLRVLNARIQLDGEDAAKVARDYLTSKGLLAR